jgi:parallel beta-helix repeat protein
MLITIEGNIVTDCAHGISIKNLSGHNLVRDNRVENRAPSPSAGGYQLDALPDATIEFRNNVGVDCARYDIAAKIVNTDNQPH